MAGAAPAAVMAVAAVEMAYNTGALETATVETALAAVEMAHNVDQ